MRVVAIDIHRGFGETAVHEDGIVRSAGRVALEHDAVLSFAETLSLEDHVVLEATANTAALARLLAPHVARVAVANPKKVRLIAEAKVKTDKVDARVLAQLYRAQSGTPTAVRRRSHPAVSEPARNPPRRSGARARPARRHGP